MKQRESYLNFAIELYDSIAKFTTVPSFINDLEKIRTNLEKVVRVSSLEKYVQNNNDVISCFVASSYSYKKKKMMETKDLLKFYKLLVSSSDVRKKIIIDSIITRLRSIPVEIKNTYNDDLPF